MLPWQLFCYLQSGRYGLPPPLPPAVGDQIFASPRDHFLPPVVISLHFDDVVGRYDLIHLERKVPNSLTRVECLETPKICLDGATKMLGGRQKLFGTSREKFGSLGGLNLLRG